VDKKKNENLTKEKKRSGDIFENYVKFDLKSDQTRNIAALIHGAPELVKKPNFRSMEKILNQSARNLWAGSIPESIVADLHGKIPYLRAIYVSGKNSLLRWVINRRSMRAILKKIAKVFFV
jgi:hypothetical protein